jgi:sugar phosphate permease
MMFFTIWYFFYIAISFKAFGESYGMSDLFLTFAGSAGSTANALTRLCVGTLMDYVSFKKIFSCVLILQFALAMTFTAIAHNQHLFLIWLLLTNAVMGATFVSTCTLFGKTFGSDVGSKVYSYFFTSYSISGVILAATVFLV